MPCNNNGRIFTFISQNLSNLQYHDLVALLFVEMLPIQSSVRKREQLLRHGRGQKHQ